MIMNFIFIMVGFPPLGQPGNVPGPEERGVIICHCQRVSEESIRVAVREGAGTLRQIAKTCRAGRFCGGCRPAIAEIIASESEPAPASLIQIDSIARAS